MSAIGTQLHVYQCWACRTTLTVTVRALSGTPYRCPGDRTPMKYLFTMPIETDEDRKVADACPVYNHHVDVKPYTKRPCHVCRTLVEKDQLIVLGGIGKFCSPACADKGERQFVAYMQRLETLYDEMPWLRPTHNTRTDVTKEQGQ